MPQHYEIRVKGQLDPSWSDWFAGLTFTYLEGDVTMLSGPLPDQAALHGLLERIRDLNLTLISVSCGDASTSHADKELKRSAYLRIGGAVMETAIRKPIPLGVYLIAAFYLFGAAVLVIGTLTGLVDARMAIAEAHGLSGIAGNIFVLLVALLALVLGYGLISLARWGYFLAIAYSLYLVLISLALGALNFPLRGDDEVGFYFGNLLWSVLVVVYLFVVRQRFLLTK